MSVYRDLGLVPIINASGAVTRLGGAPMPAKVVEAMSAAANEHVPLEILQAAASRQIAEATGAEAGLVASGAAAALTLGSAAILAGLDMSRMERLPQTDGFPNQLVIAREQRSGYDHAFRASGAELVEVGFNEIVSGAGVRRTESWEYEAAFGDRTAGVAYVVAPGSQPPLEEVVARAHRCGFPVIVDAAGELPPRENLGRFIESGADVVAFSGGKAIRGPQCTGILCGRRDLIASAALQMLDMDDHFSLWDPPDQFIDKQLLAGIPRHGLGRGMKVAKEQIVGLLTALELFVSGAYDADLPVMRRRLESIADSLRESPAQCRLIEPQSAQQPPLLEIAIPASHERSAEEICRRLRDGTPPVYVGHGQLAEGILVLNPVCVRDDQVVGAAQALLRAL